MKVRHILKDGTEVEDIKDHIISAKEFTTLYEVINRIQKQERQKHESV